MSLWPLLVYLVAAVALVALMLGLSAVLGERHRERATGEPYESGIPPSGNARLRFPADYYLVAILFVVFDLEAAYLFAWATAVQDVGWAGYLAALWFVVLLLLALVYLWRARALDFGPVSRDDRAGAAAGRGRR